MKIGLLGSESMRPIIAGLDEWAEVVWATADVATVIQRIGRRLEVDCLIVEGTVQFVTPELIDAVSNGSVMCYALSAPQDNSEWLTRLPGITRISDLAVIRPRIEPKSAPREITVESRTQETALVEPDEPCSRVIAVWGPVGAPGITTTAIAIATLAARDGHNVMLCDADTRGASVAIALGLLDDMPGFASASRLAGRGELLPREIDRLALTADVRGASFRVLTGLPRASRWAEIAAAKSTAVISLLRDLVDVVVVDVGSGVEHTEWDDEAPQRDGAARALLEVADSVVAVGVGDAVGIARLIRGLDEISPIVENPIVVLNRATRQMAFDATEAIARYTRHTISATISRDSRHGVEEAAARAESAADVWRVISSPRVGSRSGKR